MNNRIEELEKPKILNMKLILRIFLSPFVLLFCALITICLFAFPIPMLLMITSVHLISYPFILLLNYTGSEIEIPEPYVDITKSILLNYILTLTLPVWGMFAYTINYVITGKFIEVDGF